MSRSVHWFVGLCSLLFLLFDGAWAQGIPEAARRHVIRGQAAVEMARTPEGFRAAAEEFAQAVRLAPDWAEAHYNLAVVQAKAGDAAAAIESYRRYLTLAPQAPDARKVRDEIARLEYLVEHKQRLNSLAGTWYIAVNDGSWSGVREAVYQITVRDGEINAVAEGRDASWSFRATPEGDGIRGRFTKGTEFRGKLVNPNAIELTVFYDDERGERQEILWRRPGTTGITLDPSRRIKHIEPDSPAQRAGLQPGDRVGSVFSSITLPTERGRNERWLADWLRFGPVDEKILLVVESATDGTRREVRIERQPLSEAQVRESARGISATGAGCFIATAAYGSALAPQVQVLRELRDRQLLTNAAGRALVAFYYRHSPPLAAYIAERPWARALVRWSLAPVIFGVRHPLATLLFVLGAGGCWLLLARNRRAG